jgi:hypothetical protein
VRDPLIAAEAVETATPHGTDEIAMASHPCTPAVLSGTEISSINPPDRR